jgi:hypothetical protein
MVCKIGKLKRKKFLAGGGPTGDPKRPKLGSSLTIYSSNVPHPLTDLNVADEIISRGWGSNRDSIMSLTPEARQSMIPEGSDVTFDRRKKAPFGTANEGGYKYYKSIPKVIGRTLQTPKKTYYNPTKDILSQWGYDDQYSFGGWLKNNVGSIAQTAIGGAMVASGIGAPIGMGLIGSGASGMLGSIGEGKEQDEISKVYQPAISKSRQLYDTAVAEGGGDLKRLSRRTDYKGQSHAGGGIDIGIAEVENGESRTGDIVHSEKIKITPEIMKAYGGKVPFKKGDIGKSVSSLVKRSDNRFEKRSGDEWNDQARKVSQLPFEEMSDELSQIYELGIDFQPDKKADGGFLNNAKDFINDPGNASIIGSGIGLITNILRKPEKVKYQQAKFTPTNFTAMNTEASIGAIKRSYGDTKERLRRLNPRSYMNNLANIGASEAETIGDSVSKIGLANTQGMNEASMMDSQNISRLSMFNSQVGMQEAEANAANRGRRQTAIDANMNNLFTQMGQKSRDDKMTAMQEKNMQQNYEIQKGYQDIWKDNVNKGLPNFTLPGDEILNPMNPIEEDPNKLYGEFGGSIIPKTTALLSKRRYRTY